MQTWSVKKTLSYLMSGELRSEKIQQRGGERRHCADSSNPLVFCFVFRAPCHQMTMMTMRTMIVVTVTMKATRAAIPIAKQMTVLHVHKTNKLENTSSTSSSNNNSSNSRLVTRVAKGSQSQRWQSQCVVVALRCLKRLSRSPSLLRTSVSVRLRRMQPWLVCITCFHPPPTKLPHCLQFAPCRIQSKPSRNHTHTHIQ